MIMEPDRHRARMSCTARMEVPGCGVWRIAIRTSGDETDPHGFSAPDFHCTLTADGGFYAGTEKEKV